MIPYVDRVIVSTRTNAAELRAYCASAEHSPRRDPRHAVRHRHTDGARDRPAPVEGLVPGRYALFVSTIEPRKGHRLLSRVWARLRAEGVVGKDGFKLAVVGRPGWDADAILARVAGRGGARNDPPLRRRGRCRARRALRRRRVLRLSLDV